MNKRHLGSREIVERNLVFLIAVCLGGFGVGAVTTADIGTTPISSPNYVFSLHTPLTLGMLTFIFNTILIVLQVCLVGLKYAKSHAVVMLLQFPVSVVFSAAIDGGMLLLNAILPHEMSYFFHLLLLIAGSLLLALGVALQVCADVAMVSGEAFVKAISVRFKKEFGLVKTGFDISLLIIAVIASLCFTGFSSIEGVREGTIIGALGIGPTVRVLLPILKPRFERFFTRNRSSVTDAASAPDTAAPFKPVITITREYGCGGRLVGRKLAEELHLKFYDNELIGLIAKEAGMDPAVVEQKEGQLDSALLYQMVLQDFSVPLYRSLSSSDALFVASSRVIRKLAAKEPCVIVGRGADRLLKDHPHCLNVYLYADEPHKLSFCKEHYQEDEAAAREQMRRHDRLRAEYYRQYFDGDISDPRNYQLCLNVGVLGLAHCCAIIAQVFHELQSEKAA